MTAYKFVTVLLQFSQSVAYDFEIRMAAGNPAPTVRKRYIRADRVIETFHNNLFRYGTVQYLRGIGNTVSAPVNM